MKRIHKAGFSGAGDRSDPGDAERFGSQSGKWIGPGEVSIKVESDGRTNNISFEAFFIRYVSYLIKIY